ncbi:MAG: DUF1878 domain-containing protein [Lachnospiraceae bacterium]|nr:DUF1878 domain-containing protein [Lachnospiraceae bacterium]
MTKLEELFKDYNITESEKNEIMDTLDKYRKHIARGEIVNSSAYENDIYEIFGGRMHVDSHTPAIDYHFCELVLKYYADDGRWEEVFENLYGDFPIYGGKEDNS